MKIKFLFIFLLISKIYLQVSIAQSNNIPINNIPKEVKDVLEQYLQMLRNSKDLDELANNFTSIAGGSLVNEDIEPISLRNTVKPYSLKKDFENIKFYADPYIITRVSNNNKHTQSGFGATALQGKTYKIWIAKMKGEAGLPAPITIIFPEKHPFIKSPKIIQIGSL